MGLESESRYILKNKPRWAECLQSLDVAFQELAGRVVTFALGGQPEACVRERGARGTAQQNVRPPTWAPGIFQVATKQVIDVAG